MKRRRSQETGVAMITVLFVGAALTALGSVAAFTTVRELRAGTDDRRSGRALAYAEAGVDRMISYLKSGKKTWNDIALAGCTAATSPDGVAHPSLVIPGGGEAQVGEGSYAARLEVFNPFTSDPARQFAPGACNDPAFPRYFASPKTPTGAPQYFAIISTGASAESAAPCPAIAGGGCRVVRQVLAIRNVGLPVGVFAYDGIDVTGSPTLENVSMVSQGPITGRQFIGTKGTDRYYSLSDFEWDSMTNASTTFAPAAVHSLKSIALRNAIQSNGFEHPSTRQTAGVPASMNCNANGVQGTAAQSMWDQSGTGFGAAIPAGTAKCALWTGSPAGPPPTSELRSVARLASRTTLLAEDYEALKQTAEAEGLYCNVSLSSSSCTRGGVGWNFNPRSPAAIVNNGELTGGAQPLPNVFVAYFEYDNTTVNALNVLKWNASWDPCSLNPASNKTVILIVRNGNLDVSGGNLHGAVLVPEGNWSGNPAAASLDGTAIARRFDLGGGFTFKMSDCAIRSLSTLFLDFTPFSWTEVDR